MPRLVDFERPSSLPLLNPSPFVWISSSTTDMANNLTADELYDRGVSLMSEKRLDESLTAFDKVSSSSSPSFVSRPSHESKTDPSLGIFLLSTRPSNLGAPVPKSIRRDTTSSGTSAWSTAGSTTVIQISKYET